jgi:hypothetical protein
MRSQILGFIDDKDNGPAFGILLEEKRIEIVQKVGTIGRGCGDPEFPVYGLKKFGRPKTGVENQGCPMMIGIELAKKSA